jgi:hypothetical protein
MEEMMSFHKHARVEAVVVLLLQRAPLHYDQDPTDVRADIDR